MQTLGLMEVRTLLVTLLSRFHFQLDTAMGGAEQVSDPVLSNTSVQPC
jgi:hypothetical protein